MKKPKYLSTRFLLLLFAISAARAHNPTLAKALIKRAERVRT